MRLIDADALTQKESVMRKGCAYIEEINHAPTIEAEPVKHGEWIDMAESSKDVPKYRCSACGYDSFSAVRYRYCPNCGAEMDKE